MMTEGFRQPDRRLDQMIDILLIDTHRLNEETPCRSSRPTACSS
jgi:hypothetical protein